MKTIIKTRKKRSVQLVIVLLLTLLCFSKSIAQHARASRGKKPFHFGYELGVGVQRYSIKSNIAKINDLHVLTEGVYAGIKLANKWAALRANAGLSYSAASVAYSIDHLKGALSGNLYLLRIGKAKAHTLEPYALAAVGYQQAKFFGSYLEANQTNSSYGSEHELGSVRWYSGEIGGGVEFQLNNDNLQFLHFFAEGKYSVPLLFNSSNEAYAQTYVKAPVAFTLGVSFGRIRR